MKLVKRSLREILLVAWLSHKRWRQTSSKLIVNADDYGLTPGVSSGIRKAHLDGIVTSTTVLMNFSDAISAINLARESCPQLGMGVHLNITQGVPVRPGTKVSTLIDADGNFSIHNLDDDRLQTINHDQLRDEWRAQIERFLETGALLDHLDAHHHIAFRTQRAVSVLSQLAIEYGVPVRVPFPIQEQSRPDIRGLLAELDPAVRHPTGLLNIHFDRENSFSDLLRTIKRFPSNATMEIMCHPGFNDASLENLSYYNRSRELELKILTDHRLIRCIEKSGIELITFSQL
jgi:predicted glycoside hydrolase/deacetylase ChbG (UPF0249 family)